MRMQLLERAPRFAAPTEESSKTVWDKHTCMNIIVTWCGPQQHIWLAMHVRHYQLCRKFPRLEEAKVPPNEDFDRTYICRGLLQPNPERETWAQVYGELSTETQCRYFRSHILRLCLGAGGSSTGSLGQRHWPPKEAMTVRMILFCSAFSRYLMLYGKLQVFVRNK